MAGVPKLVAMWLLLETVVVRLEAGAAKFKVSGTLLVADMTKWGQELLIWWGEATVLLETGVAKLLASVAKWRWG